jgi:hypothetical protein
MYKLRDWLMPRSSKLERTHVSKLALLLILILASLVGGITVNSYIRAQSSTSTSPAWECEHAAETANPVKAENLCPGTVSWRQDRPTGQQNAIEGFTVPVSAAAGETVKLYISTTATSYSLQVYRMGWYQGLGGRLVYSSSTLQGINQPPPIIDPVTHMVSCTNWHNPVLLVIPATWVSGIYVVKLLSSTGYMRYTSFVMRNDFSRSSILFQTSVLTYQAYNIWGGYSLYHGPVAKGENPLGEASFQNRAYVVSFDRPYLDSAGLGDFPKYSEYSMLRWLERMGYDLSYTTDVDTDMHGSLLLDHRLIMAVGHDEYWSTALRNNVTYARDSGVSLAFFGGNDIYWHVRLLNSPMGADREVICYKDASIDPMFLVNPQETTVYWRVKPINEPENALLGEMYAGSVNSPTPLVLSTGASPFLSGTTLHVGSAVPGLLGGEYDSIYQNGFTPSSLSVLASSPLQCVRSNSCSAGGKNTANVTLYTTPSGAKVFDAGTFYWGWGLDNDSFDPQTPARSYSTPAFQRFTTNLLAYLL